MRQATALDRFAEFKFPLADESKHNLYSLLLDSAFERESAIASGYREARKHPTICVWIKSRLLKKILPDKSRESDVISR